MDLFIMSKVSNQRLVFITIGDEGYSRTWNYYRGVKKIYENVEFNKVDSKKLLVSFLNLRSRYNRHDIFIVMSPSQYLVPFVWFFLGKKIVLDAGWSLLEGTIISRRKYGLFMMNFIKIYSIDFIASHLARKVILETDAQKKFYSKVFLIRTQKCFTLFTGVDETEFSVMSSYKKPPDFFDNSRIVLFRGKYMNEAGLEVLAEATKLLADKPITFWVFCPGLPKKIVFSKNTFISRELLESKQEIATICDAASITLAFMSNHTRLSRTIPHKVFESAFLGKPIISAYSNGISELLVDGSEVIFFEPGNSQDLAKKIEMLFNDKNKIVQLGVAIKNRYDSTCSQEVLAKQFISFALHS